MWKGIAIASICAMNLGVVYFAGPCVIITSLFSIIPIMCIAESK